MAVAVTTLPMAVLALIAAALGALLTYGWIVLARRRRIEDLPGQRRLHAAPTPRGGGLSVALLVISALAFVGIGEPGQGWALGLGGGIALFTLVGLADDLYPLATLAKFLGQLLAAVLLVTGTLAAPPGLFWILALVLACAYVVNIWNFMDGSNGLVAVQSMLIAAALAAWPGQAEGVRLVAVVLAGACAGFMPFNLPKARVFLGDAGSHALGAAVFGLLLVSWDAGVLGIGQALLLASALLLDSGFTLLGRTLAGRRVWHAHREHLYQYAVRKGHSHLRVCMAYALWTLACIGLAAMLGELRSSLVMWTLFTVGFLGWSLYRGLRLRWLRPAIQRGRSE